MALCSIRSTLQRVPKPLYNAMFSAPEQGAEADSGATRPKPRMREQAFNNDLHFHSSFWSKIAFQDILESPSGADVHSQGRLSSRHLGFRIKCLYSSHCVVPRSRAAPQLKSGWLLSLTEREKERGLSANRVSRRL